jgi:hypothetical protein
MMVKYPDSAIRALQRASVRSKVNDSSLKYYREGGGSLKLDEQSVNDSAGPVEMVGIGEGPLPAYANPRWKTLVKRRYKLLTKSGRGGGRYT